MRGADIVVKLLGDFGVKTIFALSGNQIMPIFDACLDTDISIIHARHEAAATYMAEGYAQASGEIGVALVTAGAGLANSVAPLVTARASQTPILLISGDSPTEQDGRGAFQEMDQVGITAATTKHSIRVLDVENLANDMITAITLAQSGQPGPVHLSLPVDVLEAAVPPAPVGQTPPQASIESSIDVSAIVDELRHAKQPLIVLGPALTPARQTLNFEKLNTPVVAMQSPRGANDPNLGRFKALWREADLVLSIGKPIDFSLGFGDASAWPNARWVCVSDDSWNCELAQRNLGSRLIEMVKCAPKNFAASLISNIPNMPERASWCARAASLVAERLPQATGNKLTSAHLCRAVQDLLQYAKDPYLICDGGEFGQWAQAIPHEQRRIVNGVSGSIGGGICYAMGAKAAAPQSDVIALMGDGTAGFHLSEFETAVRAKLPFVAVIGNDRRWNAEHLLQQRTYGDSRTHGCELSSARYDLAVEALGGFGIYVTHSDELPSALHTALQSGRPACVNVEIEGLPAPTLN